MANAVIDSLLAEMQAIEDVANRECRDYTDAEEEQIKALGDQVDAEAARVEEVKENRRILLNAAMNRAHEGGGLPYDGHGTPAGLMIAAGEPRSYAKLFGSAPRRQAQKWKNGEFMRVVMNQWHDPRLEMLGAMSEGTGSAGGLLVPMQMEQRIIDRALHLSIVMSRANIVPMVTKEALIAGFSATDQSNTLHGFTFNWLGENETVVPGTGLIRGLKLEAWLGGIYTAASHELVADSPNFEMALSDALGEAMAESIDFYCLRGDGVAKPLGVLNAPGKVTVSAEGGQGADTILVENVVNMYARSSNPANAVWIASPTALPEICTMTFSAVTAPREFAGQAALQMDAGGGMSILGRPLLITSRLPVLGDEGDIALVDFSDYTIGMRQGVGIESSPAPGFTSNQATFRALVRVDGRPLSSSAYTGRDAVTYGSVVTVAAR